MPTVDERISCLEKEMVHWRTQYEMAKLKQTFIMNDRNGIELKDNASTSASADAIDVAVAEYKNCSCSSTAAGLVVKPISVEDKRYLKKKKL